MGGLILNRLFTSKPSCNELLPHYFSQRVISSSIGESENNENTILRESAIVGVLIGL